MIVLFLYCRPYLNVCANRLYKMAILNRFSSHGMSIVALLELCSMRAGLIFVAYETVFCPVFDALDSVAHSGYILFIAPWLAMYIWGWKWRGESGSLETRYRISYKTLRWFSVVASVLIHVCAYTWYLSLSRTSVAANNSVYQVRSSDCCVLFTMHPAAPLLLRVRFGVVCSPLPPSCTFCPYLC
jgi:hypothetical protein